MEAMIGNTIERAITDAGYRGHNAPPDYKFKVYNTVLAAAGYNFRLLLNWLRLLLRAFLAALFGPLIENFTDDGLLPLSLDAVVLRSPWSSHQINWGRRFDTAAGHFQNLIRRTRVVFDEDFLSAR
jgi:hypothetical protein